MRNVSSSSTLLICNSLSLLPAHHASLTGTAIMLTANDCNLSPIGLQVADRPCSGARQKAGHDAADTGGGASPLSDLQDDLWTNGNIEFYSDPADGIFKALLD